MDALLAREVRNGAIVIIPEFFSGTIGCSSHNRLTGRTADDPGVEMVKSYCTPPAFSAIWWIFLLTEGLIKMDCMSR